MEKEGEMIRDDFEWELRLRLRSIEGRQKSSISDHESAEVGARCWFIARN